MQNRLPRFEISPHLLLLLPVVLLLVPFPWFLAMGCSVIMHELCHMIAARLLGKRAFHIRLHHSGAEISTENLGNIDEMLIAAAGPCSCVFSLLLARYFPRLVLCSLIHAVYNLLPFYPLDGGRIIRCVLRLFLPQKTVNKVIAIIEGIVCGLMILSVILLNRIGPLPIIAGVVLVIRQYQRKKSCKDVQQGVQ